MLENKSIKNDEIKSDENNQTKKFTELGLSAPILKAIEEQEYDTPSPIQSKAIPAIMEGRDIMAAAQTGTGKTAGFTLPILERLLNDHRKARPFEVRVLILTPTRELAAQIGDSVWTYGKHMSVDHAVIFGGVNINPQKKRLIKGTDILVATPGRLLDLYNQNAVRFTQLEVLVLDEADRMLDMGFIHDIKKIISKLPKQRQNLMFSATFSNEIRRLAKGLVNNPVEISVTPRNTAAETVNQTLYKVSKRQKSSMLVQLIEKNNWYQVLVFSRTKHGANKIAKYLNGNDIQSDAIHGNKSQAARMRALKEFKDGNLRVLVATDIASRGIDIDQLPQVVNFDLPDVPEDYIHRIGRTGRAGQTGHAISIVSPDEFKQLRSIEGLIKKKIQQESIEGFDLKEEKFQPRQPKFFKPKQAYKKQKPSSRNNNYRHHKRDRQDQNQSSQSTQSSGSTHAKHDTTKRPETQSNEFKKNKESNNTNDQTKQNKKKKFKLFPFKFFKKSKAKRN